MRILPEIPNPLHAARTFWKDTKGRLRNFYSIPPCSVFYLLERATVPARVVLVLQGLACRILG